MDLKSRAIYRANTDFAGTMSKENKSVLVHQYGFFCHEGQHSGYFIA